MHGDEYRARVEGLQTGLTVENLRWQFRKLESDKDFDVTLDQRLAYPISEVGEVAEGMLRLSRNGNAEVGTMDAEGVGTVRQRLGEEIYDVVWNLLDLADLAGVNLVGAFERKSRRNEGREW